MRKSLKSLIALAALIFFSAVPSYAQISFKAGHAVSAEHPYHLGLLYLASLVNDQTKGQVTIEVFPETKLGGERELIEGLHMGNVDLAVMSTTPLSGFTTAFMVYDLPFIFPDTDTARRVLDSSFGEKTLKALESQDIIGLVFFENGFRHITNSKHPIINPEDMKGLTIRTMENKIHVESFQALGAMPSMLSFGELFGVLKTKSFDAQENPIPIIYTSKFYLVQQYCTLTGHFYTPTLLAFSRTAWNKLTEEQQIIIKEAAAEARQYQRRLIDQQNAEFVAKLREKGMEIIEADQIDKSAWFAAMQPVYDIFKQDVGPEVLEEIMAVIEEKPLEGNSGAQAAD
jgi:tripartite ATP-independent transporter DctP family solute receptor